MISIKDETRPRDDLMILRDSRIIISVVSGILLQIFVPVEIMNY